MPSWVKIETRLPGHPKVVRLSDRAFRAYITSICLAGEYRTDGEILPSFSFGCRYSETLATLTRELTDAGLWEERDGRLWVHDYLDAQISKSQSESLIQKRRRAGLAGAKARWGMASAIASANGMSIAGEDRIGEEEGKRGSSGSSTALPPSDSSKDPRVARSRKKRDSGEYPPDFDRFWQAYPRKTAKGAALKAWRKHKPPVDRVLEALRWQTRSDEWAKDGGEFIPYPATYLNALRWEDEPPQSNGNGRDGAPPKLSERLKNIHCKPLADSEDR